MNEQQKKAVEEAAEKITFDVHGESDDSIDDVSGLYKQGVEAGMYEVINNPSKYGLQPINQWVSVNDMPPENSGLYFVYDGKDVGIARMSVLAFHTLTSNEVYQNVTHYQTIIKPQPPINEMEE